MANFGQMLAAAQAYATPEQQRKQAQSQSQASEYEVGKEKKSQQAELEALMQKELEAASSKGGIFGKIGDLGKLLGFIPGVGTMVSAGLGAVSGAGQAHSQKSALKNLMKSGKFDKYKGTWLDDPTKAYMKDIKGLAGDIDPLKTGLTSLASSMASGKISKGIGEKFKGAFSPGVTNVSEQITGKPGGIGIKPDLLGKGGTLDLSKTLDPRFAAGGVEGIGGMFDVGVAGNVAAGGGFKELFGGDGDWLMDLIGQAGEGTEGLQALPLLMQMYGGGAGQESDTSGYF